MDFNIGADDGSLSIATHLLCGDAHTGKYGECLTDQLLSGLRTEGLQFTEIVNTPLSRQWVADDHDGGCHN